MMIREEGTPREFKRNLHNNVYRLVCRSCRRVHVLDPLKLDVIGLVTLETCEYCANEAHKQLLERMQRLSELPPPSAEKVAAQFRASAEQAAMQYDPGDSYR